MEKNEKDGVWVLTSSYNDYDQHGDYLCCVWNKKPKVDDLAKYFEMESGSYSNPMAALKFLLHVEKGGGRQEVEDQWYNLVFVKFGQKIGEEA